MLDLIRQKIGGALALLVLFWGVLLGRFLSSHEGEVAFLFRDLKRVKEVDRVIADSLPFIYNATLLGGYLAMPSARVNDAGQVAASFAYLPPYRIYSVNIQMFSHIELSGNYRVFSGVTEPTFGHMGYGDNADRSANVKFALLRRQDGIPYLPDFAIGFNDFYGSRHFHSLYFVATKEWLAYNLEITLGWSKGRIRGFFGGAAWTPFRRSSIKLMDGFTFFAEYDANHYQSEWEHPDGRSQKLPVNFGLAYTFFDMLQLKVSSLRGEKIAAEGSFNYNLGDSKGFFAKVDNPPYYKAPKNLEPIGALREEKELSFELAYAFAKQGLTLYKVYAYTTDEGKKALWLKILNIRYRKECEVRERLQDLLSLLIPDNIAAVTVVVEVNGVAAQQYRFQQEDLRRFEEGKIGEPELAVLAPLEEATNPPNQYEGALLYQRQKDAWTITLRPRLLTFFGSTRGKFKYSLGIVGGPEGYLFDSVYYHMQLSYNVKSSFSDVGDKDRYNPSQLLNVRSDTIKYYQSGSFSVEDAYLQKGFNLSKGWFIRGASGYFEPAYGGAAIEALYYPIHSNWAVGVSAAGVLKRKYHGLGFTTKIRKLNGFTPTFVHFIGYQYFLNIYYDFKPLQVDLEINAGSFLARDKGARVELARYFKSGFRFFIWMTFTNGHDHVNGKTYFDKGIGFSLPLDMFLRKSSRSYVGYATSAWLRDVGAMAETGKKLYPTLMMERQNIKQ